MLIGSLNVISWKTLWRISMNWPTQSVYSYENELQNVISTFLFLFEKIGDTRLYHIGILNNNRGHVNKRQIFLI